MESDPNPSALSASIVERLRENGVGAIRVWGGNVVRPGDQVFEVRSASFEGDVLRVVLFLALDGKQRLVEVEKPVGAEVTSGALEVRKAARITVDGTAYTPPTGAPTPALYLGV